MIIFDLDGTLADCSHRRHFVEDTRTIADPRNPGDRKSISKFKPDWNAFYQACDKDIPIKPVISIFYDCFNAHAGGVEIWSGRCESVRIKTLKWLHEHVPRCSHIDKLRMRPIGDHTPDDELKQRWLDDHIAGGGKPIQMVFDDRPKVLRMWQWNGIFTFDVGQGCEEF